MHKLDRASVIAPACLANYVGNAQTWADLGGDCKKELRRALVRMQGVPGITTDEASEYGVRCAYCEGAIRHEGHIEHFRRKNASHFPELTFEWTNLFVACGSTRHCGHYKDHGAGPYDPAHLIKPDEDDPDTLLYFHSSGEVRDKSGLNEADWRRACETIRVFGLWKPALVGARNRVVSEYRKKILSDLDELDSWPPELRAEYLSCEVEATRWEPFATTIKHFLMKHV